MLEKIIEIVSDQLSVPESQINENTAIIDDLGADSLDIVEIMMRVEDEFGVTVSDEELIDMKKVGDLVAYLESYTK